MSTGNWYCPIHFACFDGDGNFWHFRNMGPRKSANPFLIYGRIEVTNTKQLPRRGKIYNKRILLEINF